MDGSGRGDIVKELKIKYAFCFSGNMIQTPNLILLAKNEKTLILANRKANQIKDNV